MRAWELTERIEKVAHLGDSVSVYINPPTQVILDALKKSKYNELKGLMDVDGNCYFWDADKIIHHTMADKLGIDWRSMDHDPRIGLKRRGADNIVVSYENKSVDVFKQSKYFNNAIFKLDETVNSSRDVHAIALNQTIPTERGMVPNPNITDWAVKTVEGGMKVGAVHKNEEEKFELTSDFGNGIFDTIFEALEFVQTQYRNVRFN